MSTLDRRDALKVVLGGIGGIAIAKTLPVKLSDSVMAENAGKQLGTVQVMNNFPTAGRYEFNSQPIFKVSKGGKSEVIVCNGKMVIQTQQAFVNRDKKRQVNVDILEWKAVGTSELLGGPIVLTLSARKGSDSSYVVASTSNDFPANAHFAVSYEMKTASGTVSGLNGVIRGVIRALPPLPADVLSMDKLELDGVTVAASKGDVSVEPVAWAC